MAKLYELVAALENFEFEIDEDTGEILNFEELDALELEKNEKLENICLWIKNLNADAAAYKAEKDSFAQKEKATKKKAESLTSYIKGMLRGEKFETNRVIVSYRKSDRVIIDDDAKLPDEFLTWHDPTPDKVGLKKAMKAGQVFEGVSLEEYQNMSIK